MEPIAQHREGDTSYEETDQRVRRSDGSCRRRGNCRLLVWYGIQLGGVGFGGKRKHKRKRKRELCGVEHCCIRQCRSIFERGCIHKRCGGIEFRCLRQHRGRIQLGGIGSGSCAWRVRGDVHDRQQHVPR